MKNPNRIIDCDEIEVTPAMLRKFWDHNLNPITGKTRSTKIKAAEIDATVHKLEPGANVYHNLQI